MNKHPDTNHTTHYLLELRLCLLRSLSMLGIVFLSLFPFSNQLYHVLALPLLTSMTSGSRLIATLLTSALVVPIKLTFAIAVLITTPFFLYQLWSFISPALYANEKYFAKLLLLASVLLFYVGIGFSYFVIFPILFTFLLRAAPDSILIMPDINQYLDLALQLFFAFGVAFETPVVIIALVRSGVVSRHGLIDKRPYFIVAAFILAMLIGPPDVGSQLILAIPLCLLFEVGLMMARWFPYEISPTPAD